MAASRSPQVTTAVLNSISSRRNSFQVCLSIKHQKPPSLRLALPAQPICGQSVRSPLALALLLLVPIEKTSGYAGVGDFSLDADGRIAPVSEDQALVFTGLQLLRPSLFAGEPVQQVSTKLFWEKARAEGRMRGVIYDGDWMHVGDPEGFAAAQARLQA